MERGKGNLYHTSLPPTRSAGKSGVHHFFTVSVCPSDVAAAGYVFLWKPRLMRSGPLASAAAVAVAAFAASPLSLRDSENITSFRTDDRAFLLDWDRKWNCFEHHVLEMLVDVFQKAR